MTPALRAVYDELVKRAAAEPLRETFEELRNAFTKRTTSTAAPPLPDDDSRVAAAWDDALTRGGLAARIAPTLSDPGERALARVLSRAQRGVFEPLGERRGGLLVRDICRGGEFLLVARDDVSRGLRVPGAEPALVDGRIVAATDGCALLPGALFHPVDAKPLIVEIAAEAQAIGVSVDDLCDGLARMNHVFRTLPRVKIGFAYKFESLVQPPPRAAESAANAGNVGPLS